MRAAKFARLAAALLTTLGSADAAAQAPPAPDDDALPPGHPQTGAPANPHARGGAPPGVFTPPEDTEQEDKSLPPGTIAVDLEDADERPVPGEVVNLGIIVNSVAKGDSRRHMQSTTDAGGHAVFKNLETASSFAYRVSSGYQGGSFAAAPFQMQQHQAMRVVLHVYPVTHDVQQALIVAEATVAAEMRDDRVQVEEALNIYNLGRLAWQPLDVTMALPQGATAFSAQQGMSDQGADESGGDARLHGTFPPGQHSIQFRWQLPWSGDADLAFAVGMPPHVAIARVIFPSSGSIKLSVEGFPPAEVRHDAQGQSFLVTERRLSPNDPKLSSLSVGIHDLPTPGPGRSVATILAACVVALGVVLARPRSGRDKVNSSTTVRAALLEELAELERARTSGIVGPKTYERTRRQLIDALARTLAA